MSEAIVDQPASELPPQRGWTKTSWTIILLAVAAVIAQRLVPIIPAEDDAAGKEASHMALIMLELQSRFYVGAHVYLKEEMPDLPQQIQVFNRGSPAERLRFMTLAGEIQGPTEALRLLNEFDALCRKHQVTLTDDEQRVRLLLGRLYTDYGGGDAEALSLTQADRAFLAEHLGWFGQLALHPPATDGPGRAAALAPAERTFFAFMVVAIMLSLLVQIGFGALIAFLIVSRRGVVTWHLSTGSDAGGIYVETFAWWMLLFPGLSLVFALTLGQVPTLARAAAAMLLSLIVLAWPLVRGVSWPRLRQDIGLHFGSNPFLEIAAGMVCYVMMLPLLVLSIILSMILLAVQAQLAGAAAGQPEAGADFTSAPGPAHPIVLQLAHGDVLVWLQVILLASVVAPLVEETMFRGFLYRHCRELTRRLGRAGSAFLSALLVSFLFAAVHPQGLLIIPPLMALALGFSLAREWRGSLLPSMFAHGLSNGIVTTLAMIALSS